MWKRTLAATALALAACLVWCLGAAAQTVTGPAPSPGEEQPPAVDPAERPCALAAVESVTVGPRTWGCGVTHWRLRGPEWWHWQHEKALRTIGRLRARIKRLEHAAWGHTGGSHYAILLASSTFGVSYRELRAVASCETGGTFDPYAQNPSSGASGLFQFLPSTWASQGMQGFSVFDPIANALAAARIVAREGWGQWVCKP